MQIFLRISDQDRIYLVGGRDLLICCACPLPVLLSNMPVRSNNLSLAGSVPNFVSGIQLRILLIWSSCFDYYAEESNGYKSAKKTDDNQNFTGQHIKSANAELPSNKDLKAWQHNLSFALNSVKLIICATSFS